MQIPIARCFGELWTSEVRITFSVCGSAVNAFLEPATCAVYFKTCEGDSKVALPQAVPSVLGILSSMMGTAKSAINDCVIGSKYRARLNELVISKVQVRAQWIQSAAQA